MNIPYGCCGNRVLSNTSSERKLWTTYKTTMKTFSYKIWQHPRTVTSAMLLQPVEECVVTQEWTASREGMLRISVSPTNALLFPLQEGIWSSQSVRAPGEIGLDKQTCISCSEYLSPLVLHNYFNLVVPSSGKSHFSNGYECLADLLIIHWRTLLRLGRLILKAWQWCTEEI